MASDQLVCVVIPLYKGYDDLNHYEKISITNCFQVLHKHPVYLVGPADVDWDTYKYFCKINNFPFNQITFDSSFFSDIQGYNRMMMNVGFYKKFAAYQYILIHQTDCFVFRDELSAWCKAGYDYIGAPWINTDVYKWILSPGYYPRTLRMYHRLFGGKKVQQTGNGGLSLRNVQAFLFNLRLFAKTSSTWKTNEDSFYSHFVETFNPFFKIPPVKTSVAFSFDAYPETAFEMNNKQLPFGCHAWFRTDMDCYVNNLKFWEPFVMSQVGKG